MLEVLRPRCKHTSTVHYFVVLNAEFSVACVHMCAGCQCRNYESSEGTEGWFSSPRYPLPLSAPPRCLLYTFVGDLEEVVHISFVDFDLAPPASDDR